MKKIEETIIEQSILEDEENIDILSYKDQIKISIKEAAPKKNKEGLSESKSTIEKEISLEIIEEKM